MENSYLHSFLTQMVQQKHGDDTELEYIEAEVERLTLDLGEKLVTYFEPLLDSSAKVEFEKMLEQEQDINSIMQFLFGQVENLESKIFDFLEKYKADYLKQTE